MNAATANTKKKRSIWKTLLKILAVLVVLLAIAGFFLYKNFNRLLSDALMKSFNSNIISDVYELKFEKLSVNLVLGSINVHNVELLPREKPLQYYPYINSSFRLKTKRIELKHVELLTLLKLNRLKVDKIEINEPDVQLVLDGDTHVLLPFKDTANQALHPQEKKKAIESYSLQEFLMVNASFHVTNNARERNFDIRKLNISLRDLMIDQQPGRDIVSYKHVEFNIDEFTGHLQQNALQYVHFKDFRLVIDTLDVQQSPDTTIFHFADINTAMHQLDIQTADSIFHITMGSFDLSYRNTSIKLGKLVFKPNVSNAVLQRKFNHQKAQLSGSIDTLNLLGVNFNSLIYKRQVFIDEIRLDKISVSIFKDKRKPVDKDRFPPYLAQRIKAFPLPLAVQHLRATNANLVSTEIKADGSYGKANINRGTVEARNISNISDKMLIINADAFIENKAHAFLSLHYSYAQPQVSFTGRVERFDLTDLNPLLRSFTPASVSNGIVDEIAFSGTAFRSNARGTMKFLYHDLEIDLALRERAKWQSAVLAFAANTYLHSSNPPSANIPPRVVDFYAERDMNKGFINMLIRSVLSGLKETMVMSKANRKEYKETKREAKRNARKERKQKN
jgi:hypothetical protein